MADVTIKLSGENYRLLCLEMEYHEQDLKAKHLQMSRDAPPDNPDRQAAMRRFAQFQLLREVVEK